MSHSLYYYQRRFFTLYQDKEETDQGYLENFNTTATVFDQIGSTGMGSNGILTESTLKYCNKNYPDVVTKGKEETKEG